MKTPREWVTFVGIDPGAKTGLVAISLPDGSFRLDDALLVGFTTIDAKKDGQPWERAGRRALLMGKIRAQLAKWNARAIVIEEPWDALPSWRPRLGGQGGGASAGGRGPAPSLLAIATGQMGTGKGAGGGGVGASRGTIFGLGAHFGYACAAAVDLPWETRVYTYPVTTQKPKRGRDGQLGWMQRRGAIPKHDDVAMQCALKLRTLKEKPANGLLPSAADLAREEDDNVYMALGVLAFHLDRERGVV